MDVLAFEEPDRHVVGGIVLKPVFKREGVGDGGWYRFWDVADYRYHTRKLWPETLPDTRPRCAQHHCLLTWRQLHTPPVNLAKVCDGRCMGATGPACDCPCLGENHGANNVTVF
ncbi:hypothetical protein [Nonomuraea maheshkhaliensis]|uniref:hypothetical protein n=1 Tax=Nonomuraea maheshkhaliensis TaxID=419590 RepID=UPI0031F8CD2B